MTRKGVIGPPLRKRDDLIGRRGVFFGINATILGAQPIRQAVANILLDQRRIVAAAHVPLNGDTEFDHVSNIQ